MRILSSSSRPPATDFISCRTYYARQHAGDDALENLALACHRCNLYKGPNLTGLDEATHQLTRLFHPRNDYSPDHFVLRNGHIIGLTPMGLTTVNLLRMNTSDRRELRRELIACGIW